MDNPIPAADGTDYLHIVNDRRWRVRVRINSLIGTDAPTNGDVEVDASGMGLVVSVALLDENDEVATTAKGALLIFPPHVLTLQAEAMAREDFDPQAEIDAIIAQQIEVAERQLAGKNKLQTALSAYLSVPAVADPPA